MRNKILAVIFMTLAVILSSCSTVPISRQEASVDKIVSLINAGDADTLVSISKKPFLLDGEIMLRDSDIAMIWNNLAGAGFTFGDRYKADIYPAVADYADLFSDTWEVQVFFRQYIPAHKEGAVLELSTDNGKYFLILGNKIVLKRNGRKEKYPEIIGFKGPVE